MHGLAGWEVAKKPITFTHESLVNPLASFVIDADNGEELKPNADRLQGTSQFISLGCCSSGGTDLAYIHRFVQLR